LSICGSNKGLFGLMVYNMHLLVCGTIVFRIPILLVTIPIVSSFYGGFSS